MKPLALCLLLVTATASAQTTHVLFIGNSYTYVNDLPEMTRQLALSLGDTLVVSSSAPGGYTFEGHNNNPATQALIAQGGWDRVVLQEQSQMPSFPPDQVAYEVFPYAQALVDTIRAYSPCAEPTFYMTWGRENGDADNCAFWPPVCTYAGMQEQLRMNYLQMAQDNSAECAPAGVAWKEVRDEYPAIGLYSADGSHPSVAGSYLVACTMYNTFFRTSTVGASFTSSLDPATAATLQQIASAVVLDSLATWNIGINDPVASPSYTENNGTVNFNQNSSNATTHFWDLGDGATSNESAFAHTYSAVGVYTVTYVAGDACGRTDTSNFDVNVLVTGINEQDAPRFWITSDAEGILLSNMGQDGNLDLFDPQGRKVAAYRVIAGEVRRLPAPGSVALFWRFQGIDGLVSSGGMVGR